jgi:hypothetical protein
MMMGGAGLVSSVDGGQDGDGDGDTVLGTDLADEEWLGVLDMDGEGFGDGVEGEDEDDNVSVEDDGDEDEDVSVESGDGSEYGDTDAEDLEEEGMTIYEF